MLSHNNQSIYTDVIKPLTDALNYQQSRRIYSRLKFWDRKKYGELFRDGKMVPAKVANYLGVTDIQNLSTDKIEELISNKYKIYKQSNFFSRVFTPIQGYRQLYKLITCDKLRNNYAAFKKSMENINSSSLLIKPIGSDQTLYAETIEHLIAYYNSDLPRETGFLEKLLRPEDEYKYIDALREFADEALKTIEDAINESHLELLNRACKVTEGTREKLLNECKDWYVQQLDAINPLLNLNEECKKIHKKLEVAVGKKYALLTGVTSAAVGQSYGLKSELKTPSKVMQQHDFLENYYSNIENDCTVQFDNSPAEFNHTYKLSRNFINQWTLSYRATPKTEAKNISLRNINGLSEALKKDPIFHNEIEKLIIDYHHTRVDIPVLSAKAFKTLVEAISPEKFKKQQLLKEKKECEEIYTTTQAHDFSHKYFQYWYHLNEKIDELNETHNELQNLAVEYEKLANTIEAEADKTRMKMIHEFFFKEQPDAIEIKALLGTLKEVYKNFCQSQEFIRLPIAKRNYLRNKCNKKLQKTSDYLRTLEPIRVSLEKIKNNEIQSIPTREEREAFEEWQWQVDRRLDAFIVNNGHQENPQDAFLNLILKKMQATTEKNTSITKPGFLIHYLLGKWLNLNNEGSLQKSVKRITIDVEDLKDLRGSRGDKSERSDKDKSPRKRKNEITHKNGNGIKNQIRESLADFEVALTTEHKPQQCYLAKMNDKPDVATLEYFFSNENNPIYAFYPEENKIYFLNRKEMSNQEIILPESNRKKIITYFNSLLKNASRILLTDEQCIQIMEWTEHTLDKRIVSYRKLTDLLVECLRNHDGFGDFMDKSCGFTWAQEVSLAAAQQRGYSHYIAIKDDIKNYEISYYSQFENQITKYSLTKRGTLKKIEDTFPENIQVMDNSQEKTLHACLSKDHQDDLTTLQWKVLNHLDIIYQKLLTVLQQCETNHPWLENHEKRNKEIQQKIINKIEEMNKDFDEIKNSSSRGKLYDKAKEKLTKSNEIVIKQRSNSSPKKPFRSEGGLPKLNLQNLPATNITPMPGKLSAKIKEDKSSSRESLKFNQIKKEEKLSSSRDSLLNHSPVKSFKDGVSSTAETLKEKLDSARDTTKNVISRQFGKSSF